jgi:hypothetical protein
MSVGVFSGGNFINSLFAAGKNAIINGDFFINQRNFTSNTAAFAYNFDRFYQSNGGGSGSFTLTPQTFTTGSAPVSGYEARNFLRGITASGASVNTFAIFGHNIEDVRTLAGQTSTISFWAKAASGTPKMSIETEQNFGTGGSPSANVTTYGGQVTLSTSWARYSVTLAVPSISGKTIGTTANSSCLTINLWTSAGSDFNARTGSLGLQNNTFDIWGVQVEAGSVATSFQTATGTKQGELAACQRYYFRTSGTDVYKPLSSFSYTNSTTTIATIAQFPVQMRVAPTAIEYAGTIQWLQSGGGAVTPSAFTLTTSSPTMANYNGTSTGLTVNQFGTFRANNDATAYFGYSAEL